jgi:hypothetical protein
MPTADQTTRLLTVVLQPSIMQLIACDDRYRNRNTRYPWSMWCIVLECHRLETDCHRLSQHRGRIDLGQRLVVMTTPWYLPKPHTISKINHCLVEIASGRSVVQPTQIQSIELIIELVVSANATKDPHCSTDDGGRMAVSRWWLHRNKRVVTESDRFVPFQCL